MFFTDIIINFFTFLFSSVRNHHGIRRTKEMKRFMYYSLYAWGLPFVLVSSHILGISRSNNVIEIKHFLSLSPSLFWQTIFTFMIDFYKIMPEDWSPNIGKGKCWFESEFCTKNLTKIFKNWLQFTLIVFETRALSRRAFTPKPLNLT